MTLGLALMVAAGAFLGGFTTGLAGFGTGLVALGLWLHVLDPLLAAPLVVICSVIGQAQSLMTVRRAFDWRRVRPFLLGGLLGVPLGVFLLSDIPKEAFRGTMGLFLIAYAGAMLALRAAPQVTWGGRPADAVVGFCGGIMGGAAGLSGALPTIWCGLKGWSKDAQRAVFQPFNLTVLSFALAVQAFQGVITQEVGLLTLVCLPGVLLGARLGARAYGRIDDRQFRRIILWLLFCSGLALAAANLL